MTSYKMTYDEVVKYCNELADKLIAINPCLIVGVARGGLVPAVHLSHLLNLPMECLLWQTRDGGTKEDNEVISAAIGCGCTVVFVIILNTSIHEKHLSILCNDGPVASRFCPGKQVPGSHAEQP